MTHPSATDNYSPHPAPSKKGDPEHPPTTQVDQDRAPAGDRGEGARRHMEQSREVLGVPGAEASREPDDKKRPHDRS